MTYTHVIIDHRHGEVYAAANVKQEGAYWFADYAFLGGERGASTLGRRPMLDGAFPDADVTVHELRLTSYPESERL